jgi:hypothetical protein
MTGTHVVNAVPLPTPTVTAATFCSNLPGQLQAIAPDGTTIAWYDAPTDGSLLGNGNVYPLTPLYNDMAQYYAQAVSGNNCVSARVQANYTVIYCLLDGYCPDFTAGKVGSSTVPLPEAACSTTYISGKIGSSTVPAPEAACSSSTTYPGQIGSASYPAACVSYDAGWIGRSQ